MMLVADIIRPQAFQLLSLLSCQFGTFLLPSSFRLEMFTFKVSLKLKWHNRTHESNCSFIKISFINEILVRNICLLHISHLPCINYTCNWHKTILSYTFLRKKCLHAIYKHFFPVLLYIYWASYECRDENFKGAFVNGEI